MTADFKDVLYLFSCGALGKEPKTDHPLQVEQIYEIACKQGIWGTVFVALKKLYETKQVEIHKDRFVHWEQNFYARAVNQIQKRDVMNRVLSELKKNNIDAYVLKGDIIAQYYQEPLGRISGDTDIYVGEAALGEAERIFEKCGFLVQARSPMEHHTVCEHPVGGSVDLHLTFHDDSFEEKFFKGYTEITEPGITYTIDQYTFLSLGPTDNAIFLFLHLVKHFLSCGTGIRQVMDFLLFWVNNKENIDRARFLKMLADLDFVELFHACVTIGMKELQFDAGAFSELDLTVDEFFVNWLLMDIEQGGVFGKKEQRKLTLYYLFGNDAVTKTDSKKPFKFLKMYANTFKYSYLSKKYGYVKQYKILLPIAYVHRIYNLTESAFRALSTMKKTTKQNDEMDSIKNRMDVIRTIYRK